MYVNTFLGLFNLIPFAMFDGKKILAWNKVAYSLLIAFGIALMLSRIAIVS
jgi:Zn-dependent protease